MNCLTDNMRTKNCIICGDTFSMANGVFNKRKTCSKKCMGVHFKRIGYHPPHPKLETHPRWKGHGAGYIAKHNWIKNLFGSPNQCENCGFVSDNNRKIHWANRSGNYLRNKDDWMRLCVPCHSIYDRMRKAFSGIV